MRINELKIYGFKSFANKTSIRFDDNFVGIVGPNGSGKSNIIDAIRWVFGEQSSKSLRGNSSTDVIFNGTEKRKKQNFAEVTLVLDNKDKHLPLDYNEVSITRRLYRSGDSEYLINGVTCRLRDITELMMDSGMGKSSFSIISQGKIEEIVVSKPENRRQVVEEVAGVSKYKKRKEVALRKLKRTEENLAQVDIILNEMQERLGPLEKQAKKAKEFIEVKESLEKYEVSYLANKIHVTKDDFAALKTLCDNYEQESLVLNTKLATLETEEITLKDEVRDKSVSLNQVKTRVGKLKQDITKLEADYKILQERKLNTSDNEVDIKIINLNQEIVELSNKLSDSENGLQKATNEYDVVKTEFDRVEEKLNFMRSKRFELTEKLNEANEIIENSSYPYSVKAILNQIEFSKSVVVKDVFTVESEYVEAITAALGGRINEIIMPNVSNIKRAIKFLKDTKKGRATFMPIDDVRVYKVDDRIRNICEKSDGFLGFGYELIKFDPKYDKVFNNLLMTTIIVDTIDNANNLSKAISNRNRIITLSGDVVSTGGTITGGHTKKVNSLLASKNKQDLEKELNNVIGIYKNLTKSIQDIESDYHDKRVSVGICRQEVEDLREKVKMKKYELSAIDADAVTDVNSDSSHITSDLEKMRKELASDTEIELKMDVEYKELNEKQHEISLNLRELNEELRLKEKELSSNKVKMSRIEVELENAIAKLSEEYSYSYELAYQKAEKNIDIEAYGEKTKSLRQKLRILGVVNLDAIEEFEEISERYNFMDAQKQDLNSAKDKLIEIMDKLDEIVITQFEDVYIKLRAEFQIIFKELFGGGQADLVLTDPEDLLNTGIEIVSQPPGKKLQTISLLSGGEKALTAISLLFSILRIRTVPFAILDEVEAALDEANVKRYASYIKVFSENTQFLVITHRQGTMELVDNLYGITMVEKGVSSVVSVKMNDETKIDLM